MAKEYKVNFDDYTFIADEGTFTGTLDFKMYGKRHNLLLYITLYNGEKIITAAYKDKAFFGLEETPLDTMLELTFKRTSSGLVRLAGIDIV